MSRSSVATACAAAVVMALLGACGQKGPLRAAGAPANAASAPAAAPAPAAASAPGAR